MLRLKLFSLLILVFTTSLGHAQNFGKYVGKVQTEWLDNDARRMRLLATFSYVDPNGVTWTAPAGWIIDGASIPVFAWSVVGGPFNGKYRDASVIHDVACDQKAQPWEMVHEAFYWAMLASGVEDWRAKVMYAAVYHFGPRWPRVVTVVGLPQNQTPVARNEALSQAEPGSNATILRVRPQPGSGSERADFDVQIQPPAQKLREQDFEKLKQRIIASETQPAPPPSPAPREDGGGTRTRGLFHKRAAPQSDRSAAAAPARSGVSLSEIRGFDPAQ